MATRFRFIRSRDVVAGFWRQHFFQTYKPREFWGKSQNDLSADIRMTFVDYVDSLHRAGEISDRLAQSVTL